MYERVGLIVKNCLFDSRYEIRNILNCAHLVLIDMWKLNMRLLATCWLYEEACWPISYCLAFACVIKSWSH